MATENSKKLYANNKVYNAYRSGMSFNEALYSEFSEIIQDRIEKDPKFKDFTPLNMLMYDAGISKYSTLGHIMDATTGGTYTSGGIESNDWLFPIWMETYIRESAYAQNILNYICDTTIGIDGNIVKSASLELLSPENKDAVKKARVSEGADLPIAKIKIGEKAISLWKHGRAIETTYEATRRMRIDLFQKHINAIISDIARQGLEDAVDVLVNGDGNKNASTQIADFSTSGGLTSENLVDAMIDYYDANNYAADTMTMSKEYFKKMVGMTFDPTLANGASARFTFETPQLGVQNVKILMADVPQIKSKNVILLSNKSNSLLRYEENGSNIQESQQFIRNQTNLMTISENSGYAINMKGSNMHIVVK